MDIDEAGREDETVPIDFTAGRARGVANRGDLSAFNGERAGVCRSAGPVDDSRILDQQIVRHSMVPPSLRQITRSDIKRRYSA